MSATKGILQRNILLYLMHCRVSFSKQYVTEPENFSWTKKTPKISKTKTLLMLFIIFFFFRNRPSKKLKVQNYIWERVHLEADFQKK